MLLVSSDHVMTWAIMWGICLYVKLRCVCCCQWAVWGGTQLWGFIALDSAKGCAAAACACCA
jgi:hypothetical protein